MKITQLDKVHFIKVNELKLNQIEWFSFFTFKCTAANIAELFCVALLENNERLLHQLQTHETGKILDSWNDFVKKKCTLCTKFKMCLISSTTGKKSACGFDNSVLC